MKKISWLLCLIFMSGCASQQDLDTLKYQVDNLGSRVSKMDARLTEKDRVIEQALTQQANLQARYSELQNQLLAMQASIEEITVSGDRTGEGEDTRLKSLEKELQTLKQAMDKGPAAKKSLYETGLEKFKSRKYSESIGDLKLFLDADPDQSLIDNAQFWIGEALFALGKYEDAILRYDLVVKKYPNSEKVPDCLYKQGLSFIKLGDRETGELILKHLQKQCPGTNAASRAKKML